MGRESLPCSLVIEKWYYNPIEKLWRNAKKEGTHLKYFKTFEELRASVLRVFRDYLDDATKVIRVMKTLRTNAGVA